MESEGKISQNLETSIIISLFNVKMTLCNNINLQIVLTQQIVRQFLARRKLQKLKKELHSSDQQVERGSCLRTSEWNLNDI